MGTEEQKLYQIHTSPEISIYRATGPYQTMVQEYVISTEKTRILCNSPLAVGSDFRNALTKAFTYFLYKVKNDFSALLQPLRSTVMYILRGGRNFDLTRVLYDVMDYRLVQESYLTSQRRRDPVTRKWEIIDNAYCKIILEDQATVWCGDIVATGTTLFFSLQRLLEEARKQGKSINNFVFFTIGCDRAREIVHEYDLKFRELWPNYGQSIIVYVEGKFHMAGPEEPILTQAKDGLPATFDTPVSIKNTGTDLIKGVFDPRYEVLTPELWVSQFSCMSYPLQPCAIWDGGKRSSEQFLHFSEVAEYWDKVIGLHKQGMTLEEAIAERWKEPRAGNLHEFIEKYDAIWQGLDPAYIQAIFEIAQTKKWSQTPNFKDLGELATHYRDKFLALLP